MRAIKFNQGKRFFEIEETAFEEFCKIAHQKEERLALEKVWIFESKKMIECCRRSH